MKHLIAMPSEMASQLKHEKETGPGYQVVSVELKDGRRFEQAIASEGYFIAVQGYAEVPFTRDDVRAVRVTHNRWNFRRRCEREGLSIDGAAA